MVGEPCDTVGGTIKSLFIVSINISFYEELSVNGQCGQHVSLGEICPSKSIACNWCYGKWYWLVGAYRLFIKMMMIVMWKRGRTQSVHCSFVLLPSSLQAQSNSVFGEKAVVSLRNGHHAESWKSSKQQSLQERSGKIKVMLKTKTAPT